MAARDGMINLIRRLRGFTQTTTSDYSIVEGTGGTATFWSDDHLQEVLDLHRTDYQFVQIQAVPEQLSGTLIYKNYYLADTDWEEATSGSVYWLVTDAIGSAIGTANYTQNYLKGVIRFNNDQGGSVRMHTGKAYDLQSAAAYVWRQKAANAARYFSFSTDRQSFNKNQFFDHCLQMAAHYDGQSGFSVTRFDRDDLLPGGASSGGKLHDGGIPSTGWDY